MNTGERLSVDAAAFKALEEAFCAFPLDSRDVESQAEYGRFTLWPLFDCLQATADRHAAAPIPDDVRAAAAEVLELDAAATVGPWKWTMNPAQHDVTLASCVSPGWYVMQFVRWGMQSAAPRFRDFAQDWMRRVEHFGKIIPGREHHAEWAREVNHPDARLIARYRTLAPILARALAATPSGAEGSACPR